MDRLCVQLEFPVLGNICVCATATELRFSPSRIIALIYTTFGPTWFLAVPDGRVQHGPQPGEAGLADHQCCSLHGRVNI